MSTHCESCKHCGRKIDGHHHAEGRQRGKMRCAVEPYGYNAEAEGTPCSPICLGSMDTPPPITKIYR